MGTDGDHRALSIVEVHDATAFGGMEIYLLEVLGRLRERGHRVALAVPGYTDRWRASPDELLERAHRQRIPVVRPAPPGHGRLVPAGRELLNLRAALHRFDPDLVHVHTCRPQGGQKATLAGWTSGVPVIRTEHCSPGLFGGPRPRPASVRVADRLTRLVLTVSEHHRAEQLELCRRPSELVATCRTGIALPPVDLRPDLAAARRAVGLDPERRVVGAVGRLTEVKGHRWLIDAMATVACETTDVDLVIVGGGELEHDLRRQVAELGLDDRVHLVGHCDDPAAYIRTMDVTVLPSRDEGLPLALLEYMGHAKAIVASDHPALREAADDTARYVAIGAVDELANTLLTALADPLDAVRRGRAARRRAEELFDLDRHVDDLVDIYRRVRVTRSHARRWPPRSRRAVGIVPRRPGPVDRPRLPVG